MITVHIDTIQTEPALYVIKGEARHFERETIEISIRNDRRRVYCHVTRRDDQIDNIDLYGLAVRFRTGSKVWPGSATYWTKSGNVNNLRPNIDKSTGKYCLLLGYMADFEQNKNRSQHNAVA